MAQRKQKNICVLTHKFLHNTENYYSASFEHKRYTGS